MLTQESILEKIRFLARFRQRPVTLRQLFEFGLHPKPETLLTGAQFLHQELPVRLAHRVKELENLPSGLSDMPSVRIVRGMYIDSIRDLLGPARPESKDDELAFTKLIDRIKVRHNNVVPIMARGVLELKQLSGPDAVNLKIHEFLDRFYMSRIGIRMLIGQHIAIHQPAVPGVVGLIHEKCSPAMVVRQAVEDARSICLLHYSVAPDVGVYGETGLTLTYVPTHLHQIVFELLKNSMRAVVEAHGPEGDALPEIRVVIAEGSEDVTVKVSDEGGGIPRSGMPKIWTYLYTTAKPPPPEAFTVESSDRLAPIAGFGYGLPISRLYSRYFGGDIQIISMEGYGTDAYLHLRRIGNTEEALQ